MNAIVPHDHGFSRPHVAAGRIVTFALASGADDFGAWQDAAFVWWARLSPAERAALLCAAAWAAGPDAVDEFMAGRVERAGLPYPPLLTLAVAADTWASWASPSERWHYLAAIWRSLPEARRTAFLALVGRDG